MSKIWLIVKREYLTRVRNRTFIIMTILGPLLIVGFYTALIFALISQEEKPHTVCVVSDSELPIVKKYFMKYNIDKPNSNLKFVFTYDKYFDAMDHIDEKQYNSILYIPSNYPKTDSGLRLIYKERPSNTAKLAVDVVMSKLGEELRMFDLGVDPVYKDSIHKSVSVPLVSVESEKDPLQKDKEELRVVRIGLAYIFGIGIYMFILLYGVQVFRGVMEEKTNRIVEVVISSVKPFQLMMGKIIGVALVGLTQFIILITFTTLVTSVVTAAFAPTLMEQINAGTVNAQVNVGGAELGGIISKLDQINLPVIIGAFLFYFIFGYLLYASLFAAIGSAVDSEADSQQFMLPITMPLIFSFAMSFYVVNDPDGPLGTILSMFPLTAPIIMPVRISVWDQPILWQLLVSLVVQVASFFIVVKIAAKIYRTGILMYGKKPSYKELLKWLKYKN